MQGGRVRGDWRWWKDSREFDKLAKAYYFHRFYSYQPDLNTGNPTVRDEIKKIMGFGLLWESPDFAWTLLRLL
jgi:glycosidase